MERKSGKKQNKLKYEDLPTDEQLVYYERATYLIENSYVMREDVERLAKELFESKWRVVSS
jgi:hypothetical protein